MPNTSYINKDLQKSILAVISKSGVKSVLSAEDVSKIEQKKFKRSAGVNAVYIPRDVLLKIGINQSMIKATNIGGSEYVFIEEFKEVIERKLCSLEDAFNESAESQIAKSETNYSGSLRFKDFLEINGFSSPCAKTFVEKNHLPEDYYTDHILYKILLIVHFHCTRNLP